MRSLARQARPDRSMPNSVRTPLTQIRAHALTRSRRRWYFSTHCIPPKNLMRGGLIRVLRVSPSCGIVRKIVSTKPTRGQNPSNSDNPSVESEWAAGPAKPASTEHAAGLSESLNFIPVKTHADLTNSTRFLRILARYRDDSNSADRGVRVCHRRGPLFGRQTHIRHRETPRIANGRYNEEL